MAVTISRAVHDALIAAAAERPEVEICGLLYGTRSSIDGYEVTENVALDPARYFEVDPIALLRANRAARNGVLRITGYFHSHPNGLAEPSPTDCEQTAGDGMVWAIIAAGGLTMWRSLPERFDPEDMEIVD